MNNEFDEKTVNIRKILLKVLLIISIIILILWLVPKFLSYNKNVKREKAKNVSTSKIEVSSINKLQGVGLKYFYDDNILNSVKTKKKVTLEELKKEKKIDTLESNGKICDDKKTYIELTNSSSDYILKTYVTCGNEKDYKIIHVGKYEYCTNESLCEARSGNNLLPVEPNDSKKDEDKVDDKKDGENKPVPVLSEFSIWQPYQKTSCDTKEITCDINDTNCLQEVKIYKRNEIVGNVDNIYQTEHTALKLDKTITSRTCNDYNYLIISGVIFKTKGNYGEILNLNKKSTGSWTYNGTISTNTTPRFGPNEYYKYSNFNEVEGKINFIYDSYKYNYSMEKVGSTASGCKNVVMKQVPVYSVYKQKESYNRKENKYEVVCYSSVRTRTYR